MKRIKKQLKTSSLSSFYLTPTQIKLIQPHLHTVCLETIGPGIIIAQILYENCIGVPKKLHGKLKCEFKYIKPYKVNEIKDLMFNVGDK